MAKTTTITEQEVGAIAQKALHKISMDHLQNNVPSIQGMYLGLAIFHDFILKNINEDVFHIFIYKKISDIDSQTKTVNGKTNAPCKYVSVPREKFNMDTKADYPFNIGILRFAVFYEKDSLLMVGSEPKEDMLNTTSTSNKVYMECDHTQGCSVCGLSTKYKCSGCNAMRYCSKSCQKQGWNTGHKQCCKELQRSNKDTMVCLVAKTYDIKIVPVWMV